MNQDHIYTYYYLAGPMTGISQFNILAFDAAAERLRANGYTIVSPAELDDPMTRSEALASPDGAAEIGDSQWREFLRRDVNIVMDEKCKGVICLPGWEHSIGARLETYVAVAFGKKLWRYGDDPTQYLLHAIEDRSAALRDAGVVW